jgi:hypothetical protein
MNIPPLRKSERFTSPHLNGQKQIVDSSDRISRLIKPSINEIRACVFDTIMHELQHVIQGWVWGEQWGRMSNHAASKGYHKDRYELAAETAGNSWVTNHITQLSAGAFDDLIPIEIIKRLI